MYDEDRDARPVNEDGIWYAIVKIQAKPEATISEVRKAITEDVTVVLTKRMARYPGVLEDVDIQVDERFGLTPDNGSPDGPVIYFP